MNLHGNVVDPSLWPHSHALILKGTSSYAYKTRIPADQLYHPPTFTSRAAADSISDGLCMLAQRQSGPQHMIASVHAGLPLSQQNLRQMKEGGRKSVQRSPERQQVGCEAKER